MTDTWPVAIRTGWHPLAAEAELDTRPLARRLMGTPLVLYRGPDRRPVILMDRCPHRGMPLSQGRLDHGVLSCPYHGWQFSPGGHCIAVPGSRDIPVVRAQAYPAQVRAGLIWTNISHQLAVFPELPPAMTNGDLDRFWWLVEPSSAYVLDALENHLDPAHPHFLHPGLVRRKGARRPVTVTVRTGAWGAEAVYEEETSTQTWLPRLVEGIRRRSIGRYYPPTIGEVAFEGRKGFTLSIAVVFVPEENGITRPFAHFATPRGMMPAWFKRIALKAFHIPVLQQDRQALARQAANLADTGRGGYHNGPLDLLGPTIRNLAHGTSVTEETRTVEIDL